MPPAKPTNPQTLPLSKLDWEKITPFLGDAHGGVARFDALAANNPEAKLLLSPLTTQEAVSSSRIEGTQATLEEVLRFQAEGKASGEKRDDFQEVMNYREALETAVVQMEKLPLSGRLLKNTHKILLSGARGKQKDPGNFRNGPVWVGSPGATIETARYVPPEARHVPDLFSNLEKYIHGKEKNELVQLAIVHAQFEIIHPFLDGNGRLGRLLMPLFLYHKKTITTPYFYLSEYLEKHRDEYYDRLNRITAKGDWEQWIIFFLRAVAEQSCAGSVKAQKIIDLKKDTLERVQEATHSQYAPQVANFLFTRPFFTGVQFRDEVAVPKSSVGNLFVRLEKNKIITKIVPGKGRRTSFCAFPQLVLLLQEA